MRLFSVLAALAALLFAAAPAPASAYPAGATTREFFCTMTAPGIDASGNSVVTECVGGGLPYTVPAGTTYCMTQAFLVNKYPWNPERYYSTGSTAQGYHGDMHTMYLMMVGFSLPAHHPEITWTPPFARGPGSYIQAWINNGMLEAQNVFTIVRGYEIPSTLPGGCLAN